MKDEDVYVDVNIQKQESLNVTESEESESSPYRKTRAAA
jgi:hypothetical protein